jgi:hypothetical protein
MVDKLAGALLSSKENYFLAEMYIENSEWRDNGNKNPKYKIFSFAKESE